VLIPGAALFIFPLPGLDAAQAHLLGVFVATIIALVSQPVPMGVSVLVALTVLALTGTLPPAAIFSGFSNLTIWLVFTAFLLSHAVTAAGLGKRVAYLFIRRFARTPLRLAYSIAGADLVLAPFIPSDTSRGGALVFPVARSIAGALGSEPGGIQSRIGAFLMLASFHTTYIASAMFLTSMAANPLIAEFARKIGGVELTWVGWLSGSILPGCITLALVPWLLYRWVKPDMRDTGKARELARAELIRMGPPSPREKRLAAIMIAMMAGWVTSPLHGISNTFVALAGLSAILLTNVLEWDELLSERRAWDALVWFAGLVMMADALNEKGVIKLLSGRMFAAIQGWAWPAALIGIVLAYAYVHYGFASMTAQVTALYPGFLTAALAAGVPPMLAALPLAYFSSLDAATTHYGTGCAPIFFEAGYVRQAEWWRLGFLISLVNAAVWLGVGLPWWKLVGIW
jgi:DASS family divalent anion:Na+ symporter